MAKIKMRKSWGGMCAGTTAALLLAGCAMPALAQTAAPAVPAPVAKTLPPLQAPRTTSIDVDHVKLVLRFDIANEKAMGTATIRVKPLSAIRAVRLDAAEMEIEGVALANGTALAFRYDGSAADDALAIDLDREYAAGDALTLVVRYQTKWVNRADPNNIWGSFGKGLRFFKPTTTVPVKRPQIWSMGFPDNGRYWFPGRDDRADLRTTELVATVAKPLTVLSNGDLVETKDNPDGTRTFHWRMDTPYPSALTSVVVGEYVDVRQDADGIALHTYAYPDEREAAVATVERLPDMMRYYNRVTGVRYPWKRYSQVMVQDLGGGVPHAMVPTITDNMIDDFRTHADFYYLWDGVESEMLAGQWFGHLVGPKTWADAWLGQSFAHYFNGLYNEQKNGRDEFLMWQILTDQATTIGDWKSGVRRPIVTANYAKSEDVATDNYAVFRGSLVLHMLRKEIGDAAWDRAIKRYVTANRGKLVTTADFRAAVESATGKSMGWFFDQWLYRMGHPVFDVMQSWDAAQRQIVLTIRQTQVPDAADPYPQTAYFQGNMGIGIDGSVSTIRILAQPETIVRLPAATAPKLVNFDIGSTWIKEVTFTRSLDELAYQFVNDTDITAQRSAMLEIVKRVQAEGATEADKAKVRASLVKVIGGSAYWRLRSQAITQLRTLVTKPDGAVTLDPATHDQIVRLATQEKPWVRAGAIRLLGQTRDPALADLYIRALEDVSDRVINVAATALGQTRDPRAFDILVRLIDRPSWKSQSLISTLNGLKELGDPRGVDVAMKALANLTLPRWWLATSVWDYRLAAAETLVGLGKADLGFRMIEQRLKASIAEGDVNDMFGNAQLIATLGDPRGKAALGLLRTKFADDANALKAVEQYDKQLDSAIAARPKASAIVPGSAAGSAAVDERVELLSIAYRLAQAPEFVAAPASLYSSAVDRHFAAYAGHPLIAYVKQLNERVKSTGKEPNAWDVISLATHIGAPPALDPLVPFGNDPNTDAWDSRTLLDADLLRLLRQFYRDAQCAEFFKAQAPYFNAVNAAVAARGPALDKAWIERFFGIARTERYRPVLSLLGASDLGYIRVNYGKERRDTYTIISVSGFDEKGMPKRLSDEAMARLNLHETGHTFVNQLVDNNLTALRGPAEILLKRPDTWSRVKDSFYNNAPFLMRESLVRAFAIKYTEQRGGGAAAREREIAAQEKAGFVWMKGLVEQLDAYERDRTRCKDMAAFMPVLIAFFKTAAKQ
jgi:aminopeptidase N